jgi:uncharacterized protein YdaU (DUF1376 family)
VNYYERHLGDYAKDTAHLSMLEHGAYSLLLDRYYSTEQGIPEDQTHRVARARSKEERAAVDAVLQEFFVLVNGVWINNRTEEEIEKARLRIETARQNGKGGGRPKVKPNGNRNETQQKPGGLLTGSETETQEKAHHTPDTIHQTPERKDRGADAPALAFVGKVIRLTFDDFERWKSTFHAVPDMRAELEAADAHYADKPPPNGKWFFPVSNWLKRAHEQALEKQAEETGARRTWN